LTSKADIKPDKGIDIPMTKASIMDFALRIQGPDIPAESCIDCEWL